MKLKLPATDQVDNVPTWIDNWHSGRYGYCVQLMTDSDCQVGDAFYGSREGALLTEQEWEQRYNIDHQYSLKKRRERRKRLRSQ